MGECIDEVWLPQCLTIGVPYEIFDSLNPRKLKPFRKAYKQLKEEEMATANRNAWMNGMYVAHAIGSCFSKNSKYPSQPIDFTGKNKLTLSQKAELWALAMNEQYYIKHPEERPT
jgi:hypothetical protein